MSNVRITKAMAFTTVLNLVSDIEFENKEEILEVINKEIDALTKAKKMTKAQKANEEFNIRLEGLVMNVLAAAQAPMTISEIQAEDPDLTETETGDVISNQRICSVLKRLIEAGKVEKIVEKRKTMFAAIK